VTLAVSYDTWKSKSAGEKRSSPRHKEAANNTTTYPTSSMDPSGAALERGGKKKKRKSQKEEKKALDSPLTKPPSQYAKTQRGKKRKDQQKTYTTL
jgi:hypothetical protein